MGNRTTGVWILHYPHGDIESRLRNLSFPYRSCFLVLLHLGGIYSGCGDWTVVSREKYIDLTKIKISSNASVIPAKGSVEKVIYFIRVSLSILFGRHKAALYADLQSYREAMGFVSVVIICYRRFFNTPLILQD